MPNPPQVAAKLAHAYPDAGPANKRDRCAEAERRSNGAFFLVQIDRPNGQSYAHPSEEVKIEAGDTVVLVLRGTRVAAGSIFTESRPARKLGRGYR